GNWVNVNNRYMGVKFQIAGHVHFGWVRLSVQVLENPVRIKALLTGYAYETVARKPITADATGEADAGARIGSSGAGTVPQASLGLLAMGSRALGVWRREETD